MTLSTSSSDAQTQEYLQSLVAHKQLVGHYMSLALAELITRAIEHDDSKFGPEELVPYAENLPRFKTATYGTEEYRAALKAIQPAIDHHFQANRHHPEHFARGIRDMNLLDLLEMVCDWIAASQRVPGDTLQLEMQQQRFGYSDELATIITNTVQALTYER